MMKDFNPRKAKDDKRSTWWMEDKSMNYKMEKWFKKMTYAQSPNHRSSSPNPRSSSPNLRSISHNTSPQYNLRKHSM